MSQAPGPTIETERLILRPTALADFDAWAAYMALDETRFVGGPQPRSMAWRGLMTMAGCWTLDGFAMFSVIEKSSGRWIGRVGPWRPHGWPGTEVGWGIIPDSFGKGYATEAAAASMDFAFDVLGWTDIIHCIDPENTPSERVAARLGSTNLRPGRMPPPFEEHVINLWGQSAEQWRENRKSLRR